jgi:hypothetical protein
VQADPKITDLEDERGHRALDAALPACKHAMESALRFLGTFDVDAGPPIHMSATAAVLRAKDADTEESSGAMIDVALKAMRQLDQVPA